jgi:hypothetical protein
MTESQYQRERKAALPDTPEGRERERQGDEAHNDYTALTKKSKKLDAKYKEERGKQRDIFRTSFLDSSKPEARAEGDYRRNAAGLLPDQHEKLVKPAGNRRLQLSRMQILDFRLDYLILILCYVGWRMRERGCSKTTHTTTEILIKLITMRIKETGPSISPLRRRRTLRLIISTPGKSRIISNGSGWQRQH